MSWRNLRYFTRLFAAFPGWKGKQGADANSGS